MAASASATDVWRVSALYTYPVKSCQGVLLAASEIGRTGLQYDRQWMIVSTTTGRFVTQRQQPRLALIQVQIDQQANRLTLQAPSMPQKLHVPLIAPPTTASTTDQQQHSVRVWYDTVSGICCGASAAQWLTEYIGKPVRLLRKDPETPRHVSRYVPADCTERPQAAFADVFPLHLTTTPSLRHVNARLARPLEHLNFRPNIVLDSETGQAYDEESWKAVEFTGHEHQGQQRQRRQESWRLLVASRTPRCSMPNVDLATGQMHKDGEPMATLRTFRCVDPGKPTFVCFGMQAAPQHSGPTIRIGDLAWVVARGHHELTEPL
ncbi:hypothetical protein LPJ53_000921 [Coemansia erecta]|uniref:MOSC domain-containing protein n=1 Tax=Coemansia erecta TaxID=147472 RepID=A0A9W7Y6H6_9FUNG|nr:hypothetical protein LPJ53_000921 [Coemansia erecta]